MSIVIVTPPVWAEGGLWSSVEDLARWAAFLADPDPAVLAPATVTEMCAPVVMSDLDAWTSGHGLGLELWRRGERVFVGHRGSMPGYLAFVAMHRPSRTGVVAFANAYTLQGGRLDGLGLDILSAVLDREPTRVPAWRPGTAPAPAVEPLTGRWWWMGREHQTAWDAANDELLIAPVDAPERPWRFVADGPDRWRGSTGEVLRVLRGRNNEVAALDIATFIFTRDPAEGGDPC